MTPRPKSTIHYIFIGPLKTPSALNDILLMERHADNPIELVCLSKDIDAFQDALKDSKIEVKPVEKYLEEGSAVEQFAKIANRINKIKATVLDNIGRNKIADRAFFKELVAFYLLAFKGGYTLDTNVHPLVEDKKDDDKEHKIIAAPKLELPEVTQFCYPWFLTPELWMLYAPPNNNTALNILITYLKNWENAQSPITHWLGEAYYPYQYHITMRNLGIDAMQNVTRQSPVKELDAWQFDFTSPTTAKLKGFNIEKTYGSSHKHPEHLASRIEMYFRRKHAENKDSVEPEFNPVKLAIISEDFTRQLIDDINCNLAFFNNQFGIAAVASPPIITNLKKLLSRNDVTYAELMEEITQLKGINPHKHFLFLNTGLDPQKLWIKNMAEKIAKNFEERTTAMQIMLTRTIQPRIEK